MHIIVSLQAYLTTSLLQYFRLYTYYISLAYVHLQSFLGRRTSSYAVN